MKRIYILVIILLFISPSIFSQWTFSKGKSDFDGDYKTSSVMGAGGSFPYKNPVLVVNKFNNESINIYISGAGYSGCDNKVIYFKFNGDETIYETNYVSEDSNNEAWFIESLKTINETELLEKFTKFSSVSVRMKSNCNSKDYKFTLSGSSKAIKFVVGNNYFDLYNQQKQKERQYLDEKVTHLVDSLKKSNSLERNILRYNTLIEKFPENRFEFYEIIDPSIQFYRSIPLKITKNIRNYKKGEIIVIDTSFDEGEFRRVVYIEGIGMDTHYILKEENLKKVNKSVLKKIISKINND